MTAFPQYVDKPSLDQRVLDLGRAQSDMLVDGFSGLFDDQVDRSYCVAVCH